MNILKSALIPITNYSLIEKFKINIVWFIFIWKK